MKPPNKTEPESYDRGRDEDVDSALEGKLAEAWDLIEDDDVPAARRRADALFAQYPGVADVAFLLANCARLMGEDEVALARLADAARLDPEWAEPELVAADWIASQGNLGLALEHATLALDKADEEEELFDAIAVKAGLEIDLGRVDTARATLSALPDVASVEPSGEVACEIGHLHLATDQIEGARAWFGRAVEVAPEDGDAWHGLGLAAELAGDEEDKRGAWLRTLALDDEADAQAPARMNDGEVAEIAEAALAELPPRARQLLINVPIIIADRPAQADVATGLDPRLVGLFSGAALPDVASVGGGPRLTQIVLFRSNLERAAGDDDEALRDEIRTTLLHETGHFFGMTEEDLDNVGLG